MADLIILEANTPQGHRDVIVLSRNSRSRFMSSLATREKVDIAVLIEFGPSLVHGWEQDGYEVWLGPNNNGGFPTQVMNAVAYNPTVVKFLDDEVFQFKIRDRRGRRRWIHIPIVLFEVIETGERVAVFLVHVPAVPDSSDFQRGWINYRLKAYARRLSKLGIVPIVAGDRNDGHPEPWFVAGDKIQPGHFYRAVQEAADWIILRSPKPNRAGAGSLRSQKFPEIYRKASDHKAAILAVVDLFNAKFRGDDLPEGRWTLTKRK